MTVSNFCKFEVNIFSKDRDIRKMLILSENSNSKKGHNYVKKVLMVTYPTAVVPLLIVYKMTEILENVKVFCMMMQMQTKTGL